MGGERRATSEPDGDTGPESTSDGRAGSILYWTGLLGLILVAIAAGAGRLLAIGRVPGGLTDAEARHGILAQESQNAGVRWLIEGAGDLSIPLATVIRLVGEVTAFDTTTPRIAAAILGAGSVLFTGLWLRREIGPLWGLAGAAVLAGSFWHLLFSRLGIGQIAGSLALAMMLWALAEVRSKVGTQAMPWYVLAGLSAGIGFLSTPSLRLLPLALLGVLAVSLVRHTREPGTSAPGHWLAASAAAWVTISPFLIAHRDDLRLWTPWTRTPGLPGEDRVDLATFPGALIESFTALLLPADADRGLNLPSDAWFSLLMLPWAAIGLLGLISTSNDPRLRDRFLVGAASLILIWIGISAVDAGHPGQLVVISPLLTGLVISGFRTAVNWARMPTVRVALVLLIVFGVGAEAVMSTQRYLNDWADDPVTQSALNVSVVEAVAAIDDLGTDEPVFLSLTGSEDTLAYLITPARRHVFDGASVLPFPAEENGYMVLPDDEPLNRSLERMLDEVPQLNFALEDNHYRLFRLDDRVRQRLPFSAPTVAYPGGPVLYGSLLERATDDAARVLIAWNSPPEAAPYQVDLRFQGVERATTVSEESAELPANPLRGRLFQVLAVDIELPGETDQADLSVRLRDAEGNVVATSGIDQGGYLHLDRYQFQE